MAEKHRYFAQGAELVIPLPSELLEVLGAVGPGARQQQVLERLPSLARSTVQHRLGQLARFKLVLEIRQGSELHYLPQLVPA